MPATSIVLVLGLIIIALLTAGVWAIVFSLFGIRESRKSANTAMHTIAEECSEADKIVNAGSQKAMNAHALKAALSPKIETISAMLTTNMHVVNAYFVKYIESRIAAYQQALMQTGTANELPIDKFLGDAKLKTSDSGKEKTSGKISEHAQPDIKVPVADTEEPFSLDLRTGVISVTKEEPKKPDVAGSKKVEVSTKDKPVIAEKKPEPPKIKANTIVTSKPKDDDVFDFEKEIASKVESNLRSEIKHTPESKTSQSEKIEKTMKWDRNELMGFAEKSETIVVEGTKLAKPEVASAKKPLAATPVQQTPVAASSAKSASKDSMISGEDIEDKLNSFFGIDDK